MAANTATISTAAAPVPTLAPTPVAVDPVISLLNNLTNVDSAIKTLASKFSFDADEGRKLVFAAFATQLQSDTPMTPERAVATVTGAITANGKPKRTPAAFDLFAKERRTAKREELPNGTKSTEVTAALRDDWRNLSDEDKQPFVAEAKRLRQAAKPPVNPNSKKTKKATKDPNAPKRPKNGFMLFSDEVRTEVKAELEAARENPEVKIRQADVAKRMGEMWKELGEDDKAPYEQQAAIANEEYSRAKAIYDEQKQKEKEAAAAAPAADAAPAPVERAASATSAAPVATQVTVQASA